MRYCARHFGAPGDKRKRPDDQSDSHASLISTDDSRQLCTGLDIPNHETVQNETLVRSAEQSCKHGEALCAVLASAHLNKRSASKQHLHMRAYYELEDLFLSIAQRKGYQQDITVAQLTNKQCIEIIKNGEFLDLLFCVYSKIYFQNTLAQTCDVSIQFDDDEPVTVGRCDYIRESCGKCHDIHIYLSTQRFMTLKANCDHALQVGVLPCYNFLQCLMLTFEHELVHALISSNCFLWGRVSDSGDEHHLREHIESMLTEQVRPRKMTWKDLRQKGHINHENGHSRIFSTILHNLFGHKSIFLDFKNGMITKKWYAAKNQGALEALKPGAVVEVFDHPGPWTVTGHYRKSTYISSQWLAYNNESNDKTADGVFLQSTDDQEIMCPYQNIASFVQRSRSEAFADFIRLQFGLNS